MQNREDREKAEQWILKTAQIQHCQEVLFSEILTGDEMVEQVSFFTHWALQELLYMARRIAFMEDGETTLSARERLESLKTVAKIYEVVYKEDDMSFELLQLLYLTHMQIVEQEIALNNKEEVVKKHLQRALECADKAISVMEHKLTHPLLFGWEVQAAPVDNKRLLRKLKKELDKDMFAGCRDKSWFLKIAEQAESLAEA